MKNLNESKVSDKQAEDKKKNNSSHQKLKNHRVAIVSIENRNFKGLETGSFPALSWKEMTFDFYTFQILPLD